jgi:hypothetical protein
MAKDPARLVSAEDRDSSALSVGSAPGASHCADQLGARSGSDARTATGCCSNPGGQAAFFVTCSEQTLADTGASDAGPTAAAEGSGFVGVYQCRSLAEQFGGNIVGLTGGDGTLTVTQTGQVLTAAYCDTAIEGSLEFVAVANNAAVPATTNETMQIHCDTISDEAGFRTLGSAVESISVASSTLALDGDHVVLGFAGSGCGEDFSASLLCTPDDGGALGEAAGVASGGDGGANDGASPTAESGSAVAEGGL